MKVEQNPYYYFNGQITNYESVGEEYQKDENKEKMPVFDQGVYEGD